MSVLASPWCFNLGQEFQERRLNYDDVIKCVLFFFSTTVHEYKSLGLCLHNHTVYLVCHAFVIVRVRICANLLSLGKADGLHHACSEPVNWVWLRQAHSTIVHSTLLTITLLHHSS